MCASKKVRTLSDINQNNGFSHTLFCFAFTLGPLAMSLKHKDKRQNTAQSSAVYYSLDIPPFPPLAIYILRQHILKFFLTQSHTPPYQLFIVIEKLRNG